MATPTHSIDVLSNGTIVAGSYTIPPALPAPEPVNPPIPSWLVQVGDGQMPALQMVDESFESRRTTLPETNMTFPDRPVNLSEMSVSGNGKIITNLHNNIEWWEWIVDCIGERNAENFRSPGDGYMDTNAPDSDELKLMSATAGGNLRNIKQIFSKSGTKWCLLDLLDFRVIPEKRLDGWYYDPQRTARYPFDTFVRGLARLLGFADTGERMTYRSHPQYFNVRTNRRKTKSDTWLTAGGINTVNDVGIVGGKGHEAWPAFTTIPAAQRLLDMWLYPTLPAEMFVHRDSLIVEGRPIQRDGGILCVIEKYRFHGPDVYGYDSIRDNWYKLSEMLVRGTLENRDGGTGFDWRCYTPSLMPNRRTCLAPDCGWLRP